MPNDELHTLMGPALLLAGPGTGKTYQLAKRIKYLIEEENVPPDSITVITFTSAAARNMRDRISDDSKPELHVPYTLQCVRLGDVRAERALYAFRNSHDS
jgi:ATP-dependent exoDNAse (exonuclease V) beta subunit